MIGCAAIASPATSTWSEAPQTIRAFRQIGALDRLEVVVLPILLGDGIRLWAAGVGPVRLAPPSQRTVSGGSVELAYTLAA